MGHGNNTSRLVPIRQKMAARHWVRSRPMTENPHGIPGAVMKQLASENLPDKETYSKRLKELMKENSDERSL
jgi:hypothetical protein